MKSSIEFLDHNIRAEGVRILSDKVESLTNDPNEVVR